MLLRFGREVTIDKKYFFTYFLNIFEKYMINKDLKVIF